MHIRQLSVKNFRNFGDQPFVIELKPFTLILGENNVGKTNLLTAISLLFGQDISVQRRRILELDDINYFAVQRFKEQVTDSDIDWNAVEFPEVVIEATLVEMDDDQHSVVGDWYSDASLETANVTYRFGIRSSFDRERWIEQQRQAASETEPDDDDRQVQLIDFPIREYRYSIFGGGIQSNECDSQYLQMLRVEFLDAMRDASRELTSGGNSRLLYRVLNQRSDLSYADLKSSLLAVESAVSENQALLELKTQVAELLQQVSLVSKDEDNSIDFQFAAPDASELLKKIGLIYGVNPLTVGRNGLGRNNLLFIALVISQIASKEKDNSSRDNYVCFRCVGIEEPEAHLHPHLQDHLAANIEKIRTEHSNQLQLILTSHSTHLAAKLRLDNTVVIYQAEDGTAKPHYVLDKIDKKKQSDSIRFLSLYLDATKSRMLFARCLILVEGISEQTIVPELFRQAHSATLESIGCSVVNVNGVAFKHFLTVIKNGLFRRCVVLTDSDSDTKAKARGDNLKETFDEEGLILVSVSNDSTFEKDLIAANKTGYGKATLMKALVRTRPVNGKKLKAKTGRNKIKVEEFFSEIEDYKSAFAFNLATELEDSDKPLMLPDYISEAFEFLIRQKDRANYGK